MRRSTRRSLAAALNVLNGLAPRRYSRTLMVPSFFSAWVATEVAGPLLALTALRTARIVRKGGLRDREGRLAVALDVAATAGFVRFLVEAYRTDDQFAAALAPWLDEAALLERPPSVRAGAWLPVLYGGRGRRLRTRNIVYSPREGGHRLRLDVYEPLGERVPGSRRPAIVQVHGGGWVLGDKREQGIPLLNHLAHNGWVGFNVNYRLSPWAKAPEHLIDLKRAIAWIREHADEYCVDPDFICVSGGSAGGHLCAMAALTANDPEYQPGFEDADTSVQAAVPMYGVYDLADVSLMVNGFNQMFVEPVIFGSRYADDAEPFEKYSPIRRVNPGAPPMMVVHGTRDALVPIESARPFGARLAQVSRSAVVWVELQGAQHAFDVFPSPRTVRTIEYVERFLDGVRRGAIT